MRHDCTVLGAMIKGMGLRWSSLQSCWWKKRAWGSVDGSCESTTDSAADIDSKDLAPVTMGLPWLWWPRDGVQDSKRRKKAKSRITTLEFRREDFIQQKSHKHQEGTEEPAICRETELWAFSLKKRRHRGNLIYVYKYLMGGTTEDGAKLFSVVLSESTKGNGYKLKYRKFLLNGRKKEKEPFFFFFTLMVTGHSNRLTCWGVVVSPSVQMLKVWLDAVLSNQL